MIEFIILLLYVISPLDLLPGPFDDAIVIIAGVIHGIVNLVGSISSGCSALNSNNANDENNLEIESEYEENDFENNEEDYEEDAEDYDADEENYW